MLIGKMKVFLEKAFAYAAKDHVVSFGLCYETKKGKLVEAGFIEGSGYVYVNREKVFPPTNGSATR